MNIYAQLDNFGYDINHYDTDIGACILCAMGWATLAAIIMAITHLDKKK